MGEALNFFYFFFAAAAFDNFRILNDSLLRPTYLCKL